MKPAQHEGISSRRPGRPRSAQAHQAILGATLELLAEVGFEAMSIEAVAARAGVGKTTIYRRWPTKEALVIEAVRSVHAEYPILDTGSLRGDLQAILHISEDSKSRSLALQLLPRFLGEVAANPILFDAYKEAVIAPRFRQFRALFERAIARGELRADLDPMTAVDLVAGAVTYRLLITSHLVPTPPDFAEQMLNTLMRGIAARP